MTDAEIRAVFEDARGRHAQRIAWETLGTAFRWLGQVMQHEQRKRR